LFVVALLFAFATCNAALSYTADAATNPFAPVMGEKKSLLLAAAGDDSGSSLEKISKQELDRLMGRLTKTKAIGLFAKLSLKGELETYFAEIEQFHGGTRRATIEELEERYHLMVHKLIASVEKKDTALAKEIAGYRDSLWNTLADAESFASL